MGIFQVNRIKTEILQLYNDKIDISDCSNKPELEKENIILSRGLCAFTIQKLCNALPENVVSSICDAYDDNGIDAIYFDEEEITLYLVQSKWNHSGNGSPDLGDVNKFISGITDLISCRFDKFNQKVQNRSQEIEDILYQNKKLKICIVLTHTGNQFSTHITDKLKEFLAEQNDTSECFELILIDQAKLFSFIQESVTRQINLETISIKQWGVKEDPKKAYYGIVDGTQVAQWYNLFGRQLFNKNIRMILPDSEINSEIRDTILNDPENFWYYNNGITVIAESITKRPINGNKRDFAILDCENISIINGAQTVGTIGKFAIEHKEDEKIECLDRVNVQVRIISVIQDVDDSADNFADNITKANNRQNKVESRDFVSLEENQKRLAMELKLTGINYNILRSEDNISDASSFDVYESTKALSNLYSIESSTLMHREPSKVWSDIKHKRYTMLFNSGVNGIYLWNIVQIQRQIDKILAQEKKHFRGEKKAILTYGEDVISCILFSKIKASISKVTIMGSSEINSLVSKEVITHIFIQIQEEVERIDKGIPVIFKNFTHCEEIFIRCMK